MKTYHYQRNARPTRESARLVLLMALLPVAGGFYLGSYEPEADEACEGPEVATQLQAHDLCEQARVRCRASCADGGPCETAACRWGEVVCSSVRSIESTTLGSSCRPKG